MIEVTLSENDEVREVLSIYIPDDKTTYDVYFQSKFELNERAKFAKELLLAAAKNESQVGDALVSWAIRVSDTAYDSFQERGWLLEKTPSEEIDIEKLIGTNK